MLTLLPDDVGVIPDRLDSLIKLEDYCTCACIGSMLFGVGSITYYSRTLLVDGACRCNLGSVLSEVNPGVYACICSDLITAGLSFNSSRLTSSLMLYLEGA